MSEKSALFTKDDFPLINCRMEGKDILMIIGTPDRFSNMIKEGFYDQDPWIVDGEDTRVILYATGATDVVVNRLESSNITFSLYFHNLEFLRKTHEKPMAEYFAAAANDIFTASSLRNAENFARAIKRTNFVFN